MGVRDDIAELIEDGSTPGEIAEERGISIASVFGYLDQLVGRGVLTRTKIFFTLSREARNHPETADEKGTVLRYGNLDHALGDLYQDLCYVERQLHRWIEQTLQEKFGTDESEWWKQGVPLQARVKCVTRREEDEYSLAPYCYADLLDLWEIMRVNWNLFHRQLPTTWAQDKKHLGVEFRKLNRIRRNVMHPLRMNMRPPEDDFAFVNSFLRELNKIEAISGQPSLF